MENFGPQLPQIPQIPQMPMPQSQGPQDQTQQGGYAWIPGATTVGVVFSDGVILAAEKRVTYGYFIMSKGGKKVFKITDRIGVACAGLVGDMQILAKEMEAQANLYSMDTGRKISVRSAAKLMATVLFNRRYAPLITQTIVGGLDEDGPSLYVLDVLGSLIPDKYAVVGSGTELAIGVIEEGYKENMNAKEAKDLVTRSIKSAVSRDSMSGDGIDFLIITKEGIAEDSIKF
jgi:proteasome beta subunit